MPEQRKWTAEEAEALRRLYGTMLIANIAQKLSRTTFGVQAAARRLGLRSRRSPQTSILPAQKLDCEIRRLNAQGHNDAEIARLLKRSRDTVRLHRQRLGLPTIGHKSPGLRNRLSEAMKQLRKEDPFYCTYDRAEREQFALRSGWPLDLSPIAVQILNTLAALGVPALLIEIARAMRGSDQTASLFPQVNELCSRGLVVKLLASRLRKRKGFSRYPAYTLSPLSLSILEERARCETSRKQNH